MGCADRRDDQSFERVCLLANTEAGHTAAISGLHARHWAMDTTGTLRLYDAFYRAAQPLQLLLGSENEDAATQTCSRICCVQLDTKK